MPWLIARYVASEFLRFFLLLLAAFVMMILVGNVFSNLSNIFEGWEEFIRFWQETALQVPQILELVVPVTVLLATIACFGALNKTSEVAAMSASGIGGWILVGPILALTLGIGAINYGLQHYATPWMMKNWTQQETQKRLPSLWRLGGADQLYHIGVRTRANEVRRVTLFRWENQPYRLKERTELGRGRLEEKYWRFPKVEQSFFEEAGMLTLRDKETALPLDEFPSVNLTQSQDPHHLPLETLYQEAIRLSREGQDVSRYWVELHQKFAYIVALVVMVLIGFALSASHDRRGTTAESLALSCLLGIVFWMLNQIFLALGGTGYLVPWFAAWGSSLIFLTLATGLLIKNRL